MITAESRERRMATYSVVSSTLTERASSTLTARAGGACASDRAAPPRQPATSPATKHATSAIAHPRRDRASGGGHEDHISLIPLECSRRGTSLVHRAERAQAAHEGTTLEKGTRSLAKVFSMAAPVKAGTVRAFQSS